MVSCVGVVDPPLLEVDQRIEEGHEAALGGGREDHLVEAGDDRGGVRIAAYLHMEGALGHGHEQGGAQAMTVDVADGDGQAL
ncbi:hypothetical protein D3C87_928920 [compost metagenome]